MMKLITPHGGELVSLMADAKQAQAEKIESQHYPSWDLTDRQLCDIEMLLNGGFSPLRGFMSQADYEGVLDSLRLNDGTLWPIPITLDVSKDFADQLSQGNKVALRDKEGVLVAVLKVSSIWTPDKKREAEKVYGSADEAHPAVHYLNHIAGEVYLGGELLGIQLPGHYDFNQLRDTPAELRNKFQKWGWQKIVAFQTRNPMHRAHQELTHRAAQNVGANLLIHPVVGMTKPGDIDHFSRVRCYQHLLEHYPAETTTLSLLPIAMRMAGPKEAVWHAIIRKNYGCSHFIVGRDHAGPGKDSSGKDFYGPYDAQEMVKQYEKDLEIKLVLFENMVYVEDRAEYRAESEVTAGENVLSISGTEFRRRLAEGLDIPQWFSYPSVVEELRKTYPPRHKQGFVVFFTGLSGSGKSTLANALLVKLMESNRRRVTLLDGDVVRKHLSSELGFSKEHRDLNIQRIGFVASEIAKNGGVAICAPIAPYAATRRKVRDMVNNAGAGFIEIHIATSLEECEARDRKGLYAKAREGVIKEFTGISDPYEVPENPELKIDTKGRSVQECVQELLLCIKSLGYIK